jgi:hypothetical protein
MSTCDTKTRANGEADENSKLKTEKEKSMEKQKWHTEAYIKMGSIQAGEEKRLRDCSHNPH